MESDRRDDLSWAFGITLRVNKFQSMLAKPSLKLKLERALLTYLPSLIKKIK